MSFTEYKFFVFFAAVYALLWISKLIFPRRKDAFVAVNKVILLVGSYVFIAMADIRFCLSVLAVTALIYFVALKMASSVHRKILLTIGVVLVIGQLAFFKYFNFFSDAVAGVFGGNSPVLNIIAPLGISFYSFSAVGYLIDVYRLKYAPEKNFVNAALYISFFTKLVSGPLMKPEEFFSQLDEKHCVSMKNLEAGLQIVILGLFKKMVLADRLSVFVNDVFAVPAAFDSLTVLLAVLSYSLQIYFDFSGYSDIAIGFSKMIGFDIRANFNLPYVSANPTEFWKRWHISLSQWLQEYLYISLGGNRKGQVRTYLNLFLTMAIGGLWHGASFTFIVWGALNGLGLIVHKLFRKAASARKYKACKPAVSKAVSVAATFVFINVTWVFFRADSFSAAMAVFRQLLCEDGIRQIYSWFFVALIFAVAEIVTAVVKKKKHDGKITNEYVILDLTKVRNIAFVITALAATLLFAYFGNTAFIYGNF